MYALIDGNNFYVSCERSFNPCLEDKPVIVLSNRDGCVVARSNQAKALGIKMASLSFSSTPCGPSTILPSLAPTTPFTPMYRPACTAF